MRINLTMLFILLLALPALAKDAVLFHDGFGDAKTWTLQPPINAVGPIKPNGAWTVDQGAFVATGSAKPWTIQTAGDAAWTDYKLSAAVTIRKAGPKADYPIFHGEYDRYLPHDWYPKLCDHTGIYRFHYYAGEFDWGSDAAVYFRYQNRENCYRVQLSSEYQELILWHSIGGYLQVVPCKITPGQTYQVNVLTQGAHIQVYLDGKKTMDYWHECLPTLTGGIGLAAYNSTTAFQNVTVTALPAATPMPAHQARFARRIWRTQPWIFDGNEPIALMETGKTGYSPDYGDGVLMFLFVKLRPGYRPLYQTFVSVRKNEAKTALLKGDEKDIIFTGQGTDKVTLTWDGETSDKMMATHHTDVLTYDRARGTYRHDIAADLTFAKDERIFALEFSDPLTYNNKLPGRGVKYRWLPAGHAWGVMRSEDGSITRHPISQSLNIDNQNSWYLQPGNGLWVLYPDRAVCPTFEHHTPKERTYVGVCHWGYDWHQYVHWGDKPRDMKAGAKFTINHTLTGYTPQESEAYFLASKIHPKNDQPEAAHPPLYGKLPSALGFAVVDPAGTSFDKLYDTREPYVGWQWYGDYAMDREVGHTDNYALRLDGPASVVGMFYHHMIDNYATKYLCTFWVKTKGVKGNVTAKLYYPWNPKLPMDVIDTGLTGDNDWQEVSFITTVPCMTATNYDASEYSLALSGTGSVWMDDWSVRPIEEGEQVVEKRPAATPNAGGPVATPSPDYLFYLPCTEGSGSALADASGHGNHAKLYGVTWVMDNGRPVLHFAGKYPVVYIKSISPELQPTEKKEYPRANLTLDAWVKPVAGKGGDIMGYFYSPRFFLTPATGGKFTVSFNVLYAGKWESVTTGPLVTADAWSHIAGVLDNGKACVYINGKLAAEKTLSEGKLTFTHYSPVISIGTYGLMSNASYQGDMAELRWWSRAATAAELATTAAKGRP